MNGHTRTAAPAQPAANNGDQVFADIPIRRGEQLRIALSQFKGNTFVAIRIWYVDDEGLKPGNKGVNIKVDHLPDIAAGITRALEAARAEGLIE